LSSKEEGVMCFIIGKLEAELASGLRKIDLKPTLFETKLVLFGSCFFGRKFILIILAFSAVTLFKKLKFL